MLCAPFLFRVDCGGCQTTEMSKNFEKGLASTLERRDQCRDETHEEPRTTQSSTKQRESWREGKLTLHCILEKNKCILMKLVLWNNILWILQRYHFE